MLRWRNWGLKYEGVQDRALKLYPAQKRIGIGISETEWISSETKRYQGEYYFVASLVVDMKSYLMIPYEVTDRRL